MDGVTELTEFAHESTHIGHEEPEHDVDEALCCWVSSLFVSALLASVGSDGERWSFLFLLTLAEVTAGAVSSSSTPGSELLQSPQLDSGERARLSSSSCDELVEWLWALRRTAVGLSESRKVLAICCCWCRCFCRCLCSCW